MFHDPSHAQRRGACSEASAWRAAPVGGFFWARRRLVPPLLFLPERTLREWIQLRILPLPARPTQAQEPQQETQHASVDAFDAFDAFWGASSHSGFTAATSPTSSAANARSKLCAFCTSGSAECSRNVFNAGIHADYSDDAPDDAVIHDDVRRSARHGTRYGTADGAASYAHGLWSPGDPTLPGGRTDAEHDVVDL